MAMKKGSMTPPAYKGQKGDSKQVRGNVMSTTAPAPKKDAKGRK